MPADSPDAARVMALWPLAWELAQRHCRHTLARLRRGDGGFYTADDLQQDLFLEFCDLWRGWSAATEPKAEVLWAAWRRRLWGGGRRIIRRAPQRLWAGAERALDPQVLAEPGAAPPGGETDGGLPTSIWGALTAPEDAEATQARLADLRALEEALWTLRPLDRQVLYMAALLGRNPAEVAEMLGLGAANRVHDRLYRARRRVRAALHHAQEATR